MMVTMKEMGPGMTMPLLVTSHHDEVANSTSSNDAFGLAMHLPITSDDGVT
jgi:hypothetical protein